jgi:hypothetical protein
MMVVWRRRVCLSCSNILMAGVRRRTGGCGGEGSRMCMSPRAALPALLGGPRDLFTFTSRLRLGLQHFYERKSLQVAKHPIIFNENHKWRQIV